VKTGVASAEAALKETKAELARARFRIAIAQQAEAVAQYGSAALHAFFDVEVALTNETLLAQRLQVEEAAQADRAEAVRIGRVRYVAGAMDMLSRSPGTFSSSAAEAPSGTLPRWSSGPSQATR
jgi:outer membrane protein TolC